MNQQRLLQGEKQHIVGLYRKGGWSQKRASEEFNVSKLVVSRLLSKKGETRAASQRKGADCPRKTHQHEDGLLLHYMHEHPFSTSVDGCCHLYETQGINVLS